MVRSGSKKTFFHKCGEYQQGVTGVAEIQEYINELVKNTNIEKDIGSQTQMQRRLNGKKYYSNSDTPSDQQYKLFVNIVSHV